VTVSVIIGHVLIHWIVDSFVISNPYSSEIFTDIFAVVGSSCAGIVIVVHVFSCVIVDDGRVIVQSIFVFGSGNIQVRDTINCSLSNPVVHKNQLNVGGLASNRFISHVIVLIFPI
jgi:hypothetical protein